MNLLARHVIFRALLRWTAAVAFCIPLKHRPHARLSSRRSGELGRITVQAVAVGRELYSGMFDEFPDLKFVHTMFGGNWFALQNLLAPHVSVKKKEAMNRLATNISREDYFRYLKNNIYFDSTHPMSWSKEELECAVQVCGADHILLGSSFPVFYEWMTRSVGAINALDIDEEDRKLILGGNAARLFNL